MNYTSADDGRPLVSPSKLLTHILSQTGIYILQFEGTEQIRSQIQMSTGQVRTNIEVRTRAGRGFFLNMNRAMR